VDSKEKNTEKTREIIIKACQMYRSKAMKDAGTGTDTDTHQGRDELGLSAGFLVLHSLYTDPPAGLMT